MAASSKQDLGNTLDLVDIKEIKESTVTMRDGSLRQIIMVGGVNFALKSTTEQNIIVQAYQTFLNGIEFPMQILVHSRKVNVDKYVERLEARKEIEQSAILQNQIDEYVQFVKGFVQKNAIMEKAFLVVVPFYPSASAGKSVSGFLPFFGGGKKKTDAAVAKSKEESDRIFQENLAQLNQRSSQVMTGLLSMDLDATLLGYEQLVELFYNFYNPQTVERKDMPIPRQ